MREHQNQHQHPIRWTALPSGRTIEVMRFDKRINTDPGLHVCPACDSELVQPVEWAVIAEERWALTLHCPNCEWSDRGTYDHEQVAELEERLDDGVAAILRDLKRLTDANTVAAVERFAAALEADLILPEDF